MYQILSISTIKNGSLKSTDLTKFISERPWLQSAESKIPLKILADWITQLDKLDISAELTSTRYGMTFLNFNSGRIRVPRWQNSLQIARVPRKTTKTKFTLFKMWLSNINISEVLDMLTSGWTGFRHSTVSFKDLNWLQALGRGLMLDISVLSMDNLLKVVKAMFPTACTIANANNYWKTVPEKCIRWYNFTLIKQCCASYSIIIWNLFGLEKSAYSNRGSWKKCV